MKFFLLLVLSINITNFLDLWLKLNLRYSLNQCYKLDTLKLLCCKNIFIYSHIILSHSVFFFFSCIFYNLYFFSEAFGSSQAHSGHQNIFSSVDVCIGSSSFSAVLLIRRSCLGSLTRGLESFVLHVLSHRVFLHLVQFKWTKSSSFTGNQLQVTSVLLVFTV